MHSTKTWCRFLVRRQIAKLDIVRLIDKRQLSDCKGIKQRPSRTQVHVRLYRSVAHGDIITWYVVRSCMTYFLLVVYLQFWLVCGQRCFDWKTRLTSKSDFFQLIFWGKCDFLVGKNQFLIGHSFVYGTWFEGKGPPSPPTSSDPHPYL